MCCNLNEHLRRLVQFRINNVTPSNYETQVMDQVGVSNIEVMRSFLAWRRTTFLAALPLLLLSAALGSIELSSISKDFEDFSGLGRFVFVLPAIGNWIFFGFCVAAAWRWNNWPSSAYFLKIGWGASFILPIIPALFPLEHIIASDVASAVENGTAGAEAIATFEAFKVVIAISYLIQLLPVVISFPGGCMRAALRIRALLPESSLSSWILVISAPFYSVLILMALVVILQLAGNALLIAGSLLLTISPWVYVAFRRLLVTVSTPEGEKRLDTVQRCTAIANLVGFLLILTSPDISQFITATGIVKFVVVGWSRTIVTTVMFGDVFLRMSITNWKADGVRRNNSDDQGDRIDMLFQSLEVSVKKSAPSEQSASEADDSEDSTSRSRV